jgi:hypothetical protein
MIDRSHTNYEYPTANLRVVNIGCTVMNKFVENPKPYNGLIPTNNANKYHIYSGIRGQKITCNIFDTKNTKNTPFLIGGIYIRANCPDILASPSTDGTCKDFTGNQILSPPLISCSNNSNNFTPVTLNNNKFIECEMMSLSNCNQSPDYVNGNILINNLTALSINFPYYDVVIQAPLNPQPTCNLNFIYNYSFANVLTKNIICNGSTNSGEVKLTTVGGVGSIVYTISPNAGVQPSPNVGTFTNLPANIYTITATDASLNTITTIINIGNANNSVFCCNTGLVNTPNVILKISPTASNLIADYGNVINGRTFFIDGTFIIDEDITFNNCIFWFTANSKIHLNGTYSFNANYSTFRSACETMWLGFETDNSYQEINLRNCFVRDMEDGVILKNNAKSELVNNQFINNFNSIQIYNNSQANNISIIKNTFKTIGTLFVPHNAEKSLHGINIDNCENLNIGDLNQPESGNNFDNLLNGICINTHIYITGGNPLVINYMPVSNINLYNNSFKNIYNTNSNLNFEEIGMAIFAKREDPFNDLRVSIKNTNAPLAQPLTNFENCSFGVVLKRASGTLENQTLKNCFGGFGAIDCNGKQIHAKYNTFNDVHYAIYKSGDENASGFFVLDNQITLPQATWFNTNAIYSQYSSTIHVGISKIHSNIINIPKGHDGKGIILYKGFKDVIYNNQVHITSPVIDLDVNTPKMIGIYSDASEAPMISNNIIDNNYSQNSNLANYVKTNCAGIYLTDNKMSRLHCNTMNYIKLGVLAVGANGSNNTYDHVAGNFMNNSDANFLLWKLGQEGSLGQIGANTLTLKFDANNTYLDPHDINTNMDTALLNKVFRVTDCIIQTSDEIVTNSNKLNQSRSSAISGNLLDCKVVVTNPPTITETYQCMNGLPTISGQPIDVQYAIKFVKDSINYTDFVDGVKRANEEQIMQWLAGNASVRANNPILDSFYLSQFAGILGQLNTIDHQISLLNDSTLRSDPTGWLIAYEQAHAMNNTLNGSEVFEQNAKFINTLYLNTLLRGIDTLNEEQRQEIETLALTCPYVGGNAVYRARVLYGMWQWNMHYDELEICNNQGAYKGGNSKLQDQLTMIKNYIDPKNRKNKILNTEVKLYPNPVSNKLIVECQNAQEIIITDIIGRVLLKKHHELNSYRNEINTSALPQGVYIIRIKVNDESTYTNKFIKE